MTITVRLLGRTDDEGELSAKDVVDLVGGMRQIAYRQAKSSAEQERSTVSAACVRVASDPRVRIRDDGATVRFTFGPPLRDDGPRAGDGFVGDVRDRVRELVHGIATGERPGAVTLEVAGAVRSFLVTLQRLAPRVALVFDDDEPFELETGDLDLAVWRRPATAWRATVVGTLELLDLATGRARIAVPIGRTLEVEALDEPASLAPLLGRYVAAVGAMTIGATGAPDRMRGAVITAEPHAAHDDADRHAAFTPQGEPTLEVLPHERTVDASRTPDGRARPWWPGDHDDRAVEHLRWVQGY